MPNGSGQETMSIESLAGSFSEKPRASRQCGGAVLMIRPAAFDYNPETALTNRMQRPADAASSGSTGTLGAAQVNTPRERARAEFDGLVRALQSEGITVCSVP